MSLLILLLIFHPVLVTIVVAGIAIPLFLRSRWGDRWRLVLIAAGMAYVVDAAFALPRIVYAWGLSAGPVVTERTPLPARLVLLGAECDKLCHERLFSGALQEIILDRYNVRGRLPLTRLFRYRVGWAEPGQCPDERRRQIPYHQHEQTKLGFCPVIEETTLPAEGIFVVKDQFLATASQPAGHFESAQLSSTPPGPLIQFAGVEVQRRAQGKVEVLASRRKMTAPGLTGLPPLIGCWERPDNIIWIMPPGDTKCGFWRWFTGGGDLRWQGDADWVFADVFTAPDRPFSPPPRDR